MKKYYTDSDGGAFLIGNKDFSFFISNNYGDCRNTVLVFESEEEYKNYCIEKYGKTDWRDRFKWQTTIKGKFNLYNYDCSDMSDKDVKAEFNGKYGLYLRSNDYERPILAIVRKVK